MQRAVRRNRRSRLSGSDTGFLWIESDTQTSTCTHAVILAPPDEGQEPLTREELRDHLGERLGRTPALGRVLQHVPGGIGHPLLVDHPCLDLDALVDHAVLPAPGDDPTYHAWVAERLVRHLDLDRSLWQVTLVDGFADGRQALVFAFHHTLADGAALFAILAELLDDRVLARRTLAPPRDLAPHPRQHPALLLLLTLVRQLVAWTRVPFLLPVTVRRFRRARLAREASPVPVPPPAGGAPACVLNTSYDARRAYARTSLRLEDLRRVRAAAGTGLSDVVLAVVAGALRTYLGERGQLPEQPLVVNVPLGHDRPGAPPRLHGNGFCNYYATLPTHVADPRARLATTARNSAAAKRVLDLQGRGTLITWLDLLPPRLGEWGARSLAAKHRAGEVPPDFNLLVSNLKVPEAGWRMRGRAVEEIVFSGPVADGSGLNVTVVGYGERVVVAVQSNPSAVEDPAELAERLHDALAELVAAYAEPPAPDVALADGQVA